MVEIDDKNLRVPLEMAVFIGISRTARQLRPQT